MERKMDIGKILIRDGILYAGIVTGILYVTALLISIAFGSIILGLTALTGVAWAFVFTRGGGGSRMGAANPESELFLNAATQYGKEGAPKSQTPPVGARALIVLTGASLIGWLVLIFSVIA